MDLCKPEPFSRPCLEGFIQFVLEYIDGFNITLHMLLTKFSDTSRT